MGRFRQPVIVFGAAVAAGLSILPVRADQSAARASREQTIFVSVTDKQGRPATDLTPANFTVREDGTAREVLKVEPATTPLQIAILMDTSQAAQGATADLRDAIKAFSAAVWAKSPDSQIQLYTFGERPTVIVEYTSTPAALQRGIDRVFAASGSGAYLLDAIIEAARGMAQRKAPRAAVVAFVDENGPEFSNRRHDQVFQTLGAGQASLWTIARQGFNAEMTPENRERASVLGDVTTRSGGRNAIIFASSSLKERFTDVASELLSQWAVTYGRPESLIPPERLDVRLNDKSGYRLAAPRWANR